MYRIFIIEILKPICYNFYSNPRRRGDRKKRYLMKTATKKLIISALCVITALCVCLPSFAFRLDGQSSDPAVTLTEGVVLTHLTTDESSVYGLQNMNVIEFDPSQKNVYLNAVGAGQYANDRATVKTMIETFADENPELTPLVAVNGDLWMMGSAHARVEGGGASYGGYSDPVVKQELTLPRGFNMYGGEIICSAYMYAETPYEGEFWSLGITDDGQTIIGCPTLSIKARASRTTFSVDGFNRLPANDSLVLYSDKGCLSNYALDDAYELLIDVGKDYTVTDGSAIGGTVVGIYDESVEDNPTVSETTMILTARGKAISRISSLKKGDSVSFLFTVGERYGRQQELWKRVTDAVGGHMPFVVDGVKNETGVTKGYPSTIVGIKNDGEFIIIVNDGRQPGFSRGLDFNDYAALTDELDINTGFILDGGGSAEMVVLDESEYTVVNSPSDGRERSVINSLILSIGPERQRTKNQVRIPDVPDDISSLYFTAGKNAGLIRCNTQSAVEATSEGILVKADKYNGDVYFNVCYGLPGTALPSSDGSGKYPTVSVDEYPYVVLDMKAATSDSCPVQFQTVYVSAGEDRAASGTNFAGFNNLINDGKFHRYIIDLSSLAGVKGRLNLIRIGYLLNVNEAKVGNGDGVILRSIRLAKTMDQAKLYAEYSFPFTDVPYEKWYAKAADYCYEAGYISGTSDRQFSPDMIVTRAMFATILAKIDGADLSGYGISPFTDVPSDKWYTAPIAWASEHGLASGTGNGRFSPGSAVTREQLATFLCTYAKYRGNDVKELADLSGYSDRQSISAWAVKAIAWAVNEGIISGTGAGRLSPKAETTRSQVAQMVMRFTQE